MSYYSWTSDLDVNVDIMNNQHKKLIRIMEELYQLNERQANKLAILDKLDELNLYARKHFQDEEQYMASVGYKDLERHSIVHQQLSQELSRHTEAFRLHFDQLSNDFFHFLRHWLTAHIRHIDAKYGGMKARFRAVS
jgi:hemerythrin